MDAFEDAQVDYDDLRDRICTHSNGDQRNRIEESFDLFMGEEGLRGISFSPKPKSISGRARKGIWETDTGIKVIWDGVRSSNELNKETLSDGSVQITIKANNITEKE